MVAGYRIAGGFGASRYADPVAAIVGLVAEGVTSSEIIADYPQLADDDVRAALEFAAAAVSERQLPLRIPA